MTDDSLRMRLWLASSRGKTHLIRWLLQSKANPDVGLHGAAQFGHTDTVRELRAHKADVRACGWDGYP